MFAQSGPPTPEPSPAVTDKEPDFITNAPEPTAVAATNGYIGSREFIIALMISILALVTLVMEFFLLRRTNPIKSEDILRIYGVTFIIFGTLEFVVAGFDSNQIATAMGLFGTIAGYLLGRASKKEAKEDDKDE